MSLEQILDTAITSEENMSLKALIIEDELSIANLIKVNLSTQDIEADIIQHGNEAIDFIQSNNGGNYSLFILDRMLPAVDGIEICKFLRMFKPTKEKPILMVTALTNPKDIVSGLDAGADDYVTKPFDINVLNARVRSLIRRSSSDAAVIQKNPKLFDHKGLKVDLEQCKVWAADKEVNLTVSEYKLLCSLIDKPGKVLTRKQLVESIQGGTVHVTDRTIDTHVFGLRKKLQALPTIIETIRGIGYRILND